MLRNWRFVFSIVLVFSVAGVASAQGADTVYVSTNGKGYVFDAGDGSLLLGEKKAAYGDLVLGPDGMLYGCDPSQDRVFRYDPTAETVEDLFPGSVSGPQCGWFTAGGDLLVTSDNGVWVFDFDESHGLGPVHKLQCVSESAPGASFDCPAEFDGEGITQAADGDILAVDSVNGTVWSIGYSTFYENFLKEEINSAFIAADHLVGIARTSNGDVFIGDGDELLRFGSDGSFIDTCGEEPFGGKINFIETSADDTLYVAVDAKGAGELWAVPFTKNNGTWGCGTRSLVFDVTKKEEGTDTMVGVAVGFTSREGQLVLAAPEQHNFYDSVFEFTPTYGCSVVITAREATIGEVDSWIDEIEEDLNINSDNPVKGSPVVFLGDNGRPLVYDVSPSEGCGESTLAINAFHDLVPNPRIGHRHAGDEFSLIQLTSYFPFDGIIPDDARTGGRTPNLSEFFLVNVDLHNEVQPGTFCGFTPPLTTSVNIDDSLPEYNAGSVVPIKFKVAEGIEGDCSEGPFLKLGVTALLSVAKVRDDANERDFDPIEDLYFSGGYDPDGPPIFQSPTSESTPYNLGLDTDTFDPGTYQIVVIALTDNFPVQYTYFKIKP